MADPLPAAPAVSAPDMSEAEAEKRLGRDRFDLAAIVAKADHRFRAEDHRAAAAFYNFAVKRASSRGIETTAERDAVRRASVMVGWLSQRFRHHILSSLERLDLPASEWPPRLRAAIEILLGDRQRDLVTERFPQMPRLFFYPGLPYVDFVDPANFPWVEGVKSRFADMRDEAARLLADTGDFQPYVTKTTDAPQGDVHGLLENPDWSSLYLWTNGGPVESNAARCPAIYQTIMEKVPLCHIGHRAPAVLLSLLKPGARIPPHNGMLNIRYICHIPLIVPAGCRFRVGERTVEWHEGELLMFDDTVEHEAHNGSGEDRLVVIFDIWNPALSESERNLCRAMLEAVDQYR